MFLETNFGYAIYDFLEDKRKTNKYENIEKMFGKALMQDLEEIKEELFVINNGRRKLEKTSLFLIDLLNNRNLNFYHYFKHYLVAFNKTSKNGNQA